MINTIIMEVNKTKRTLQDMLKQLIKKYGYPAKQFLIMREIEYMEMMGHKRG